MITIEGHTRILADLTSYPGASTRAMVRAINRSMTSGRALMVSLMAKDMGISSTAIRNDMPIMNATWERPVARIGMKTRRLSLLHFKARQTRQGVTWVNPGVGGRKTIRSAFIARMTNGYEGAFERHPTKRMASNPKRQAIVVRQGPSYGGVFLKFRPDVVVRIQESYEKNFDHELAFEKTTRSGT